ncbi:hypothetical protein BN946_scf184935.g36 [Trametes cinnabarina]|uniref:Methyltransferase type 11 domain-containing protein n=1 Tax=Pycnoporus cinnabarinus TaxID=5643 RepID=A0A060SM74_PYCCI|nr:hypothetical protein BN946_scf184935.g36 [Trametes cinnabarina]
MPPDYESRQYWNARFDEEKHFEWLGDGIDTIIPHVSSFLLNPQKSGRYRSNVPARLLHIGAGTSSLSERLRELYISVYGDDVDEIAIVNTDFAETLVARKREAEAAKCAMGGPQKGMRWVSADALKWNEMSKITGSESELFDLVVEKSTSDAISCGEDVTYCGVESNLHPAFHSYLAAEQGRTLTLSPVEVFAIHLASLVRPGGLWIALTFSSNRFSFMPPSAGEDPSRPRASDFWTTEEVVTVDAPTGLEGNAHAPLVQHYVYIFRRQNAGQRNGKPQKPNNIEIKYSQPS